MTYIAIFLLWTLMLYWVHRVGHKLPWIRKIHNYHHGYVNKYPERIKWHWNNLFLYNDNWESTIDLWVTEVIPTIIFCIIFNSWWIFAIYYIWTALIQEHIEHNPNVNKYPFTSGKWHLIHHKDSRYNYALFFPLWDKVFGTEMKVNEWENKQISKIS